MAAGQRGAHARPTPENTPTIVLRAEVEVAAGVYACRRFVEAAHVPPRHFVALKAPRRGNEAPPADEPEGGPDPTGELRRTAMERTGDSIGSAADAAKCTRFSNVLVHEMRRELRAVDAAHPPRDARVLSWLAARRAAGKVRSISCSLRVQKAAAAALP